MKHFFKKILVCCLFVMICFVTGCKKDDKYHVTVSEVAHSVFYAPFYVALNNGYFDEVGLSVDVVLGNGANNVMASLLSKDADIGLAGAEATIYVYNQGQKDYAINFCQLTQRDGNFLVGRTKEFAWNNLKGKTILGGRQGGMPVMVLEYALKQLILNNLDDFLKQLGVGFTYVGNEYKIKAGNIYNYIDLLLYNIKYKCYVVIELKVTELKKEHTGQIMTYMNYIDKNIKTIEENDTVGIIVCKQDNEYVIKYCFDDRIIAREYELV